jgi:hypothetical protein
MRFKYWKTGILLASIFSLVFITPNVFSGNYDRTYNSQVQFGLVKHQLYVSVPLSLYDYYRGKTPTIAGDNEYSKLVTPEAVKPIAENLRNITLNKPRNNEEFANAVLTIVHQIPYAECDLNYPVETLVENSGKCDTLSLLAASIMKAGGLDVVLLYFKEVHHINVGVHLPYQPHTSWWWLQPTGYEFNGKKYWIAECTPATEWKVGDVPPLLQREQPCIIPLENSEQTSPAQVSSKLGSPLNSSSITINLSSDPSDISYAEKKFNISGSISPAYPNETISAYFSKDGISYNSIKTETDNWGNYSFSWNVNSTGTYLIRTSWSGNSDCTGADSETLTVFLGFPKSLIQFKGPGYYYTYGRAYIAAHELRVRQGVEDFLDVQLSGRGVLLTGEFIILKSGQIITTPRVGETKEGVEKVYIPKGFRPLRLPDNIEQTTNNQFGVILRNGGGNNYTLNVRGLDDYDVTEINQLNGNGTTLMNTTAAIKENTWYKVIAKISEDKITAELHDTNGTIIESIATADDAADSDELVVLLTNNIDRAIAFKNLSFEPLNQTTQPDKTDEEAANNVESLAPYVSFLFLVATILAVAVYVKKRKRVWQPLNFNKVPIFYCVLFSV